MGKEKEVQDNKKQELAALTSYSLRGLVEQVNRINASGESKILREDVVSVLKENEAFFLLYFK